MDARTLRVAALATALLLLGAGSLSGASARTQNFVVTAPTQQAADGVAQGAERFRKELAVAWLGHELPNWQSPCPITVTVGEQLGAGGATTFMFDRGRVFGWRMSIQGSYERIMDSVLPHEVTHTVFATHFRQPLPRWADEGACTTIEHHSERAKHQKMLIHFLRNGRGIAFDRLFAMTEYPHDIMPLYAQGYSIARYLIERKGRRTFVKFVEEGLAGNDWAGAVTRFYGHDSLLRLQNDWLSWVRQGSPRLPRDSNSPEGGADEPAQIASAETEARDPQSSTAATTAARPRPEPNLIYHWPARPEGAAARGDMIAVHRSDQSPAGDDEAPDAVPPVPGDWRNLGQDPATGSLAADHPFRRVLPPSQRGKGPSSEAASTLTRQEVTRPQPPQPTRQIILQWSREDSSPPTAAATSGDVNASRDPLLTDAPGGTIRR